MLETSAALVVSPLTVIVSQISITDPPMKEYTISRIHRKNITVLAGLARSGTGYRGIPHREHTPSQRRAPKGLPGHKCAYSVLGTLVSVFQILIRVPRLGEANPHNRLAQIHGFPRYRDFILRDLSVVHKVKQHLSTRIPNY